MGLRHRHHHDRNGIKLKSIDPNKRANLNSTDYQQMKLFDQPVKIPKIDCSLMISDFNQKISLMKEKRIKQAEKKYN